MTVSYWRNDIAYDYLSGDYIETFSMYDPSNSYNDRYFGDFDSDSINRWNSRQFTLTDLAIGGDYTITCRTENMIGQSLQSNEVYVTPGIAPIQPYGIATSNYAYDQVLIAWNSQNPQCPGLQ